MKGWVAGCQAAPGQVAVMLLCVVGEDRRPCQCNRAGSGAQGEHGLWALECNYHWHGHCAGGGME